MYTKSSIYSFQLDEQWFTLDVDLLRSALGITPKDLVHPFVAPPVGDVVKDFVNTLGYPEEFQFVSKMHINSLYQPWRSILSMINQCLTGKTSGYDRPKHPVIQMLWGLPSPSKKANKGKVRKVRKGKRTDRLVDESNKEPQPAPKPPIDDNEYNRHSDELLILPTTYAETYANLELSVSEGDTKILNVGEEQDPGKTTESQPPPEHEVVKEDQAGSNPGQCHVALVGPNPKPMHEDFVATVYPQVHEILKHTTEEHVQIENPPSSSGTLSSMKNLDVEFTFGDHFLNDKPTKEEPGKANVETEVESMVTVPIHQASSSAPPLSIPVIVISSPKQVSPPIQELDKTAQALSSRVYTLENHDLYSKIDNYVNETIKEAVQNALQALESSLYDALEASMDHENRDEFMEPIEDVSTPDDVKSLRLKGHQCCSSSKDQDQIRLANAIAKSFQDPEENKLLQKTRDMGSFIKWYCKRIRKSKLTKGDLEGPAFKLVKLFHKNNISLQFQMEECHLLLIDKIDLTNLEGNRVVPDVSKPLPLVGPPGQVTIQTQYLFNKDLEYLVSGDKEKRNALSISKLKAAYYIDFRLEELVLSLWIESECEYNISAAYDISYWWFKDKEFYITRHSAPFDHRAVRSHMRILSVVSLKTFYRYGYTYLKEIVLRKADYKECKILESGFKNLHPIDFEDLYLLHLQSKLNHLSGTDKVALFSVVNLWIRNIVIRHRVEDLQLEDYTSVYKPRAIIYRDRNNQKKTMRETEVHKFSDGTLTRILEQLDHMVKDFGLFKFNPSMEHRIWSEDDKRRSKEFIEVIERRLKIRRIFRNLESFVSRHVRDVDYRLIQRTE
ncbi:hypothetical protein Tco_0790203 [Tanacetum coccineum]